MKALKPAIIVVSILILLTLTPVQATGGACIVPLGPIPNNQCWNSTNKATAGFPVQTLTTYDGTPATCANSGGVYNAEPDLLNIDSCTPGCCCDDSTLGGNYHPELTGSVSCGSHSTYEPIYTATTTYPSCREACQAVIIPPQPSYCGPNTYDPTTQTCCSDGNTVVTKGAENTCPALSSLCQYDTPLQSGTTCTCFGTSVTIADSSVNKVCCSQGGMAPDLASCSALPPSSAACGDGILQYPEQCDSPLTNPPGCSGTSTNPQICTSSCRCLDVTSTTPTCGNGICERSEDHTACPSDCLAPPTCAQKTNAIPTWTKVPQPDDPQLVNSINMNWTTPAVCATCAAQTGQPFCVGYRIQRSNFSYSSALNSPDKTWSLSIDDTGFQDTLSATDKATATVLYYSLIIEYADGTVQNTTRQVNLPSPLCPIPDISYCQQSLDANGNPQGEAAVTCTGLTPKSTQCTSGQICTYFNNAPLCVTASTQCNSCNGLFACFIHDTTKLDVKATGTTVLHPQCNEFSTCYKDTNSTSVELYQSCTSVDSCLGYQSKDACEANQCRKPGNCVWTSLGMPGYGVCTPQMPAFQVCKQCESLGDPLCTQQACSQINSNCVYFNYDPNNPPRVSGITNAQDLMCRPKGGIPCEDILTKADCIGNPETPFAIDSDHNPISSSNDIYGDGKCAWLTIGATSACWKDSDHDGVPDWDTFQRMVPQNTGLLLDFTNPITNLLATPGINYSTNFRVNYTSSGNLSVCFQRVGDPDRCESLVSQSLPDNFTTDFNHLSGSTVTPNHVNYTFTADQSGDWIMRYYSEDLGLNLEPIRDFSFNVDAMPPSIVNFTQSTAVLNTSKGYRLRDYILFNTTKPAWCDTSLLDARNNPTNGITQGYPNATNPSSVTTADLTMEYNNKFAVLYPAIVNGSYRFYVNCTDARGNTADASLTIVADNNFNITNVTLFDLNALPPHKSTSMLIQVLTPASKIAYCSYGPRGTLYKDMTPFTVTGGITHNSTIDTTVSRTYSFQEACNISGTLSYGDPIDDILFSTDNTPPVTSICDSTATGVACQADTSQPRQVYVINFSSTDYPLSPAKSFGVNPLNISYCINTSGSCSVFQPYRSQRVTLDYNVYKAPVYVTYYANDTGGNVEAAKTQLIQLGDMTPPQGQPQWNITP